VRPGHRRSLMRRALIGIVPDEILNRKRKAFVVRGPMVGISAGSESPTGRTQQMAVVALGIVDATALSHALQLARQGQQVATVTVMRTSILESWLANALHRGTLSEQPPMRTGGIAIGNGYQFLAD